MLFSTHSAVPPTLLIISSSSSIDFILGTLSKIISSLEYIEAYIAFIAVFLDPDILTEPINGVPPSIKTEDINLRVLLVGS